MNPPVTGRRWKVGTTSYYGTPSLSQARSTRERAEYRMEGGPNTAQGDRVSKGDIAVPSNIPLNSVFYVPMYGWGVARDHGGAIRGNRIDLAQGGVVNNQVNPEARKAALAWGRKNQTVYVFPPGYQIPNNHAPPQAFLNDLRNQKINRAAETKSSAKLTRDNKIMPVNNKTTAQSPKGDSAFWKLVDEGPGKSYDNKPGGFRDWSEAATGNYEIRLEKALTAYGNNNSSLEETKNNINKIEDGLKYWIHKDYIQTKHAKILGKKLDDARKTIEPITGIQPNSPSNSNYKQVSDISDNKITFPDPVATSRVMSPSKLTTHAAIKGTPVNSLSSLGSNIASQLITNSSNSIPFEPKLATDEMSKVQPSDSLATVVAQGTPTEKPIVVPTKMSPLATTVASRVPTPVKDTVQPTTRSNNALTKYIYQINETDRIKSDSVKGDEQYAAASKSFNNVRKSINSSELTQQQKSTLQRLQGDYPYRNK